MERFNIIQPLKRKTEVLICLFFILIPFTPILLFLIARLLFLIARLLFLPLIIFLIPIFLFYIFYLLLKIIRYCNGIPLTGGYKLSRNNKDIIYNGKINHILNISIYKIGWNENWIICCFKNTQSEYMWYAINLKTKKIIAPFSEEYLKENTDWNSIQCDTCENVWNNHCHQSKMLEKDLDGRK